MEKKTRIPEDTHSLEESLRILQPHTTADLQEYIGDIDLNGWTFIDETGDERTETTIDTEPDWIPDC